MRRTPRWLAAVLIPLLFAGCAATTSDVGGEAFSPDDALWTGIYVGILVLGVASAKVLLEGNE